MSGRGAIKKYQDGDIVFKEGDVGGSAFVIVKGSVELTKNSKHGAVLLARLKVGELFGEMGIIDGSPRSATARTVGSTTLKEIEAAAFLNGIQSDPDLSSKVMGKLVERLRNADAMLANAGLSGVKVSPSTKAAPVSGTKKQGFFSRFFNPHKGREKTFEILIADFFDDENQKNTIHYYETLKKVVDQFSGALVNVRRTGSAFGMNDFNDSPMVWGQMQTNGQRWLKEVEGDLLIWGQMREHGQSVHLRMVQAHPLRNVRAGLVQPCDAVDLPSDLDDTMAGYLYGVSIGALVASTVDQRDAFDALIGPALDSAQYLMKKKIRELEPDEQARLEIGYANLMATFGVVRKQAPQLQEAEEIYLKVLRTLRRTKSPLLSGIIKRHLGFVQSAWYDNGGDKNLIEAAIESFRDACNSFTKEGYPLEWAAMQSMIGQLLFKMDQEKDDSKALKEAISAYQNALQVFTATSTPQRWGEAKHFLGRALQLLGSQTGDLDLIVRSAEACREALVVRSRSHTPMLWAATQNNLGSALFMLCQKTKKPETAHAAVKAFRSALEVYVIRKADKLAKVTQKNLTRAEEVADSLGPVPTIMTPEHNTSDEDLSEVEDALFDEDEPDEKN
jgi:tetratricopeptide (TPR) repeat protein